MKRVRSVVVLLVCALTVAAGSLQSANATPDQRVEQIRGQGSDTTFNLMTALSDFYNRSAGCNVLGNDPSTGSQRLDQQCGVQSTPNSENWDHDIAVTNYPVGSGNGINMLTRFGQQGVAPIDYARSSRNHGASDAGYLRFVAFAHDAIPWADFRGTVNAGTCAVDRSNTTFPEYDDSGPLSNTNGPAHGNDLGTWPDGPDADTCPDATVASSVSNLTLQQVKDIFTNCTITNWSQLDATKPNVPIVVWADQAGSGTRSTYDGFLGSGSNSTNCVRDPNNTSSTKYRDGDLTNGERVIFENDATPIVKCATDPDGAGPQTINCPDTDKPGGSTFTVHYTQSIYYYATGPFATSGTTPLGQGADLGCINSICASQATVGGDNPTFPFTRSVYNVFRDGVLGAPNPAPDFVTDFMGPKGWICKEQASHQTDPATGVNYATEIQDLITAQGFFPLGDGAIGDGLPGNSFCRAGHNGGA